MRSILFLKGSLKCHSHQQKRYLYQEKYSLRNPCLMILLKSCKNM